MHLGHHKIPFEEIPAGTTERQLRQDLADTRRDRNRLEDRVAELEAEVRHLRQQQEKNRRWWQL